MCGIFGVIIRSGAELERRFCRVALEKLASLSLDRGKDSSGVVFKNPDLNNYKVVKGDLPVSRLLKTYEYKEALKMALLGLKNGRGFQAMGHARLVTNGSQLNAENNQPVIKDSVIGIHNGIIVNDDQLWQNHSDIVRKYRIDTEVLLSLLRKQLTLGLSLDDALSATLNAIEGTVSTALFFQDYEEVVLATNNGSLYYMICEDFLLFASEKYFLEQIIKKLRISKAKVSQLKAFTLLILTPSTFHHTIFNQRDISSAKYPVARARSYDVKVENLKGSYSTEKVIDPASYIDRTKEGHLFDMLEFNVEAISKLRRCSKCILPETFPFIEFDHVGECNFCRSYKRKLQHKPLEDLKQLVSKYKSADGKPDCIVPFSGGRDSTYALHIVKEELGLHPIAFTYDWGMVTDLARRNIARVCGKLGVENIIISADIEWKRENIRKNINAWLKNPSLGMIPIFMAGDKYFYYYANKVKKRNGIALNLFGMNDLENTDFKIGFAGIPPNFDKKRIYSLTLSQKFFLFKFVAAQYFKSTGYFNQSILDTFGSFFARYLTSKKDYYHLFDYLRWDEKQVDEMLLTHYNWEKAVDTDSTWRIGDGTASFYNYIYYTVAGFSEYDTFRSNQIREGMITRDQALEIVNRENRPRYETLRWYLDIVGLQYVDVVKRINEMPKLYRF